MKLRDIFAFRDPPESETSKPFLEHLEDLRWTIVKMAIVLIVAMFLCFAFRQRLVVILQAADSHGHAAGLKLQLVADAHAAAGDAAGDDGAVAGDGESAIDGQAEGLRAPSPLEGRGRVRGALVRIALTPALSQREREF